MLGRLPEEVACMRKLEEPEGLSWLRIKGKGRREPRRARVRVGCLGQRGKSRQSSRFLILSHAFRRKEQ